MEKRRVMAGLSYLCCGALLGGLGCSGESAVVGGNESKPDGAAGGAAQQREGKVKRWLDGIRNGPGLCLPYQLPLDADGTAACKIFTMASPEGPSCACDAPGRAPVSNAVRDTVLEQAKLGSYCDQPDGPACAPLPVRRCQPSGPERTIQVIA